MCVFVCAFVRSKVYKIRQWGNSDAGVKALFHGFEFNGFCSPVVRVWGFRFECENWRVGVFHAAPNSVS